MRRELLTIGDVGAFGASPVRRRPIVVATLRTGPRWRKPGGVGCCIGLVDLGALDGDAYAALWDVYKATGIRPEYLLPVLYSESGFNPAARNAGGYPYIGINQASETWLRSRGIDPDDYLTWPASAQIRSVVLPMLRDSVTWTQHTPKSATRTYQMNFLPASVKTARALHSVLAWRGSGVYAANAGFDWMRKGAITVADLSHFVGKAARAPAVTDAIRATYAQAPAGVGRARNPVYGRDFFDPLVALAGLAAIFGGLKWWQARQQGRRAA